MKILLIFFLLFILTIVYAVTMDLITGMNFQKALKSLKNPFWVITIPEFLTILILALGLFINPGISFIKKLKQKSTKKNA